MKSQNGNSEVGEKTPQRPALEHQEIGLVTALLRAWARGDARAGNDLMGIVYGELRRRASLHLRHERLDHTLSPTALVHEAYLRLIGQRRVSWRNRAHFFGVAAQMMRRILVDHARARRTAKRPNAALKVTLHEGLGEACPPGCDLLLLDEVLNELSALDPQQAKVVELRYFGGLTEQEIAQTLSISRSTVTREWQTARTWLYRRITRGRVREAL